MPRASITLMPLADTFRVMVRLSDGTKNFFFCTFGSKRRFVRRCECEMLCPKPGTAPVTWHTAAMVSFLIWLPWGERPTQGHLSARRYRELCETRWRTKKAAFLRSTLRCYPRDGGCATGCGGRCGGRAHRAQAEHVDHVMRVAEAVLGGDLPRPRLHGIRCDLLRVAALAADEVMMMAAGRARAVDALAVLHEGVGLAGRLQVGEGAVDGRQAHLGPGAAQRCMQGLCRHEALGATERLAHRLTLPRVALHATAPSVRTRLRRLRRRRPARAHTAQMANEIVVT